MRRIEQEYLKMIFLGVAGIILGFIGSILIFKLKMQSSNDSFEITKEVSTTYVEPYALESTQYTVVHLANSYKLAENTSLEQITVTLETYGSSLEPVIDREYSTGYTTANVNVRSGPSTNSEILDRYPFNTKVEYIDYNDEWYEIKFGNEIAYINSNYISSIGLDYESYTLSSSGFKSYMSYEAITSKNSRQYKLQHNYAYTGAYGIRQVDGRYCVAIGTAVDAPIGTYLDLILENGTVIPCILSDRKAEVDTLEDNFTSMNGCVSEFLVDMGKLRSDIKTSGDVSNAEENWNSPVVEIRVYDRCIFN